MIVDFAGLSTGRVYHYMTQTLLPRPIAWVLSDNGDGSYNLAPFSYFSAVSSDPPLVMLSLGKRPDGSPKDTRANIERHRLFVIHIPDRRQAQAVTASSVSLAPGESELDLLGLETVPFEGFALPRLAACRVAYACRLYDVQEIGQTPQALIFGQVERIYVADACLQAGVDGASRVVAERLDPLGRLGADEYAGIGGVLRVPRPA